MLTPDTALSFCACGKKILGARVWRHDFPACTGSLAVSAAGKGPSNLRTNLLTRTALVAGAHTANLTGRLFPLSQCWVVLDPEKPSVLVDRRLSDCRLLLRRRGGVDD